MEDRMRRPTITNLHNSTFTHFPKINIMDFSNFFKLAVFICVFHLSNAGGELQETMLQEMTKKYVEATFPEDKLQEYRELQEAGLLDVELKNETKNYTKPSYDPKIAKLMLEHSAIVYVSDVNRLKTWSCLRCHGATAGFKVTDVVVDILQELQGYVGYDKKNNAIIIAFRGTKPFRLKNWLVDSAGFELDVIYPGMHFVKIHSGFFLAWHFTALQPGITAALKKATAAHAGARIIVTGHSLGGAMAAVCALDLTVNDGYKDLEVITFGQPRIGNAAFSEFYLEKVPNTLRVVSNHDIVPQVPPFLPRFPHLTYHHHGTEVWVHVDGVGALKEQVCDPNGEDPTCVRSSPLTNILDHILYYGVQIGCIDPCPFT